MKRCLSLQVCSIISIVCALWDKGHFGNYPQGIYKTIRATFLSFFMLFLSLEQKFIFLLSLLSKKTWLTLPLFNKLPKLHSLMNWAYVMAPIWTKSKYEFSFSLFSNSMSSRKDQEARVWCVSGTWRLMLVLQNQ